MLYTFIKRYCPKTYLRIRQDERDYFGALGMVIIYPHYPLPSSVLTEGLPIDPPSLQPILRCQSCVTALQESAALKTSLKGVVSRQTLRGRVHSDYQGG